MGECVCECVWACVRVWVWEVGSVEGLGVCMGV